MERNVVETLGCLIGHLSIAVTRATLLRELERQPNNDTLFGISEVLEKWKITNAAYQLPAHDLVNDLCPFIVYMTKGIKEYEFALVTRIDEKSVILSNENWKYHVMPRSRFDKIYTGAVLIVEPEEGAGEPHYRENRRQELIQQVKIPFILVTALLALLGFLLSAPLNGHTLGSLLAKSMALAASAILVIQTLQTDSPWAKRFCIPGQHADCNDITSSKAAVLLPGVTWAEIGLLYFSATLLLLMTQSGSESALQLLAGLSLLCLPYVIYSIIYQAFVAGKWCVLCSAIQIMLVADSVALWTYAHWPVYTWPWREVCWAALALMTPAALWMLIKPAVASLQEFKDTRETLLRFKGNDQFFQKALSEQPAYSVPQADCAIVLGNPRSEKIITVVSNPYCNPCAKTHKAIDDWLAYTDDLQVRLVLTSSMNDSEANRHLIALTKKQDHALTRQALSDWYRQSTKNYTAWARRYPLDNPAAQDEVQHMLQQQNNWCATANVPFTPLVIVNGHQLPQPYLVEDLKYLM